MAKQEILVRLKKGDTVQDIADDTGYSPFIIQEWVDELQDEVSTTEAIVELKPTLAALASRIAAELNASLDAGDYSENKINYLNTAAETVVKLQQGFCRVSKLDK